MSIDKIWLGLTIGNSRLHWARFIGETLHEAWDTEFLAGRRETPSLQDEQSVPLYLASVVPTQTALWQDYPDVRVITLEQIPLRGLYPTLGIDRALAVLGAGETYGYPCLVIDAGTALTFTGVDENRCLVGGAILPGLKLQLESLSKRTAALPQVQLPSELPTRWAKSTPEAIESGIVYTVLSGVRDFIEAWWHSFPGSRVVVTGGDRAILLNYLQSQSPDIAAGVIGDRHLIFWGMRKIVLSFEF